VIESLAKRGSGSRESRLTWLRQCQSPRGPPVGKAPGIGCAWLDGPDPPGGQREKAIDVTPLASGADTTSCPDLSVAASMSVESTSKY